LTAGAGSAAVGSTSREGGIVRLAFEQLDYMDPALAYSGEAWALLDTTCARLMVYPDKPPPEGLRLVPEVATAFPKISPNGKTYTFRLRKGFRFSDGTPVHASAFVTAINRALALGDKTGAVQYVSDVAGAAEVAAGKTDHATGVVARGNTLVIRFTRPTFDFAAKTTMPFFCAVPPTLPPDPEGVRTFPAAGPYYVTDYRPGERVSLRRNPFYKGTRPHHVEGFDAEITGGQPGEGLDRVERGDADWTWSIAPNYFEPGRRLAEKYGVNKSRFFVKPGFTFRSIVFNHSRPLFRNNARLRQAVNFAIDRRALSRVVTSSALAETQTDQFLPASFPGYKNVDIYPLARSDVRRAKQLARGATRGGKATFYVADFPPPVALAQLIKRQLARIGLNVTLKSIPSSALLQRLSNPREPWDLTLLLWQPDFIDPYTYINSLFDSQSIGSGANIGRFASPNYDRLMRQAAHLQGTARYRAYGRLDVQLARDAAASAPTAFFTEPTLVSPRLGCLVLRPVLDLIAVCLK
jgi:peptide/nickel transport system substrate-binding protein